MFSASLANAGNARLARRQLAFDILDGWWPDAGENSEHYCQACLRVRAEGANQD
ncbi:MAG TPA: hypothetical protein PKK06_01390 [Phycisphaerae bacterium]|nr:hypothetical protein [Phycisphaerae bacterium]HNU46648.1 hypothetical protein [Phycisphaerae bacterium]